MKKLGSGCWAQGDSARAAGGPGPGAEACGRGLQGAASGAGGASFRGDGSWGDFLGAHGTTGVCVSVWVICVGVCVFGMPSV